MRKERISALKVLRSAAGYYVGRTCTEDGIGEVPYSRESGYYPNEEGAYAELVEMTGEECDHYYVPYGGEYSQMGSFICTKCNHKI